MIVVGNTAVAINSISQVEFFDNRLTLEYLSGESHTFNETESADFLAQVNAMAAEAEKQLVRQRAAQSGIIGVN